MGSEMGCDMMSQSPFCFGFFARIVGCSGITIVIDRTLRFPEKIKKIVSELRTHQGRHPLTFELRAQCVTVTLLIAAFCTASAHPQAPKDMRGPEPADPRKSHESAAVEHEKAGEELQR